MFLRERAGRHTVRMSVRANASVRNRGGRCAFQSTKFAPEKSGKHALLRVPHAFEGSSLESVRIKQILAGLPAALRAIWRGRDAAVEAPPPEATMAPGEPGQFVSGSYANRDGARPYKLYIPASYAGQRLPLVVMLHGCSQTADAFASTTRMNALAEEQHFFVLYPEQTRAANRSMCWNWFKRTDQRRGQGEPAILAGMTQEVMRSYRIDEGRVYVAGLSAGGAMAAVMATVYPEIFAAVGVHSGLACGSAHDLPSALAVMRGMPALTGSDLTAPATPTIVFHGDRDRTVHVRNGEHLVSRSLQQNGVSGDEGSVERAQAPDGRAYTRTVHRDSTGRVVLEYWKVHDGGHAWFGGSPRGSYSDPRGPDAAREMLRFFLQNALAQHPVDRFLVA
jgi:poly(hydroxyalkanoate) depolymerase family esterase